MNITNAEEQILQILWERKETFFKDLMDALPEPKPAATTVATLLKRLQEKQAVTYQLYGNSRAYTPNISKSEYLKQQFSTQIKNRFNNSAFEMASFFTKNAKLTQAELQELKSLIDQRLKSSK
jgi:BlaI family transcriptional regulator, penicillinase repressor